MVSLPAPLGHKYLKSSDAPPTFKVNFPKFGLSLLSWIFFNGGLIRCPLAHHHIGCSQGQVHGGIGSDFVVSRTRAIFIHHQSSNSGLQSYKVADWSLTTNSSPHVQQISRVAAYQLFDNIVAYFAMRYISGLLLRCCRRTTKLYSSLLIFLLLCICLILCKCCLSDSHGLSV